MITIRVKMLTRYVNRLPRHYFYLYLDMLKVSRNMLNTSLDIVYVPWTYYESH
jgi:hypothetical protein